MVGGVTGLCGRGVCDRVCGKGVCVVGCTLPAKLHAGIHPHEQTDTCENITLWRLSLISLPFAYAERQ